MTVWAEMLLLWLLLLTIVVATATVVAIAVSIFVVDVSASVFAVAATLLLTCSSISLMSHCPLAIFCSDTNEPSMGPPSHDSQWKGSEDLSGPV